MDRWTDGKTTKLNQRTMKRLKIDRAKEGNSSSVSINFASEEDPARTEYVEPSNFYIFV